MEKLDTIIEDKLDTINNFDNLENHGISVNLNVTNKLDSEFNDVNGEFHTNGIFEISELIEIKNKVSLYNPLSLAYIGDGVFELLIRQMLMENLNLKVSMLHKTTITYVCAKAQSAIIQILMPYLTEDEELIYKRGRNANGNNIPKNADVVEYRRATGFECLIGYLYLTKQINRIDNLFNIIKEEYINAKK